MPTEEDLHATFGALELAAPNPVTTLAGLDTLRRRRTARRRITVMAAVAVVTTALAAGSLAAPGLFRTDSPGKPPAADGPWSYRFAVDPIPGEQVSYGEISKDHDSAEVFVGNPGAPPSYSIMVFAPGAYDPAAARQGSPVDVAGKPGFYREDMPCLCDAIVPIPGLAWEYAPNAWAYVRYSPKPFPADLHAQLLRVAKAVRTDQTTLLRVPFRIGYLPAGMRANSGGTGLTTMGSGGAVSYIKTAYIKLAPADVGGGGLGLTVQPSPNNYPLGQPTVVQQTVSVNVGPFEVTLWSEGEGGTPLSIEELKRIARSVTAAGNFNDPSTWIPANEAIPLS